MHKLIRVFLVVFLLNSFSSSAFELDGGFLGYKHKVDIGYDFHPFFFLANQYGVEYNPAADVAVLPTEIDDDWSSYTPDYQLRTVDIASYSLNYEFALTKSSAVGLDMIFRSATFEADEDSYYSDDNITLGKYSGVDVRLKYRRYLFSQTGMIAPLGVYMDYMLSLPFTTMKYEVDDAVEKASGIGFGMAFGKQGIIAGNVTFDYGISFVLNSFGKSGSEYLSSGSYDYYSDTPETITKPSVYQNNRSNWMAAYLKVGYLIY